MTSTEPRTRAGGEARTRRGTDAEPLLRVRDLSVVFRARGTRHALQAVDGVSFDIAPGTTLGLVGESGSGKTTTGRAILQLQPAAGGSVELLGKDLTTMSRGQVRHMRRHMQFVLQNPYSSLHPRMTVERILAEPLRVHRTVPPDKVRGRVAELLELVGLDPGVAGRYPHEFSGGQRQRIVIARALAPGPDFVVCDEPVSALDVRIQSQIVSLLTSLQDQLGVSYLFIAHDLAVVREISDRVAVMYGGKLVELGDADEVYRAQLHPYTQMLMAAVPIPDPEIQRARLAAVPETPDFRGREGDPGPCVFGEDHSATGTPAWHQVSERHGVSCQFWPPGVEPHLPS
jgi:oligopeptide/dipeptide ABC transporter ATP-binding protein